MADKPSVKIKVYETKEALYEKAVETLKACDDIIQYEYKVEMLNKTIAMLDEVGDYSDSAQLAGRCRSMIEEAGRENLASRHGKAKRRLESAVTLEEYQQAENEFSSLKDYSDSAGMAEKCKKQIKSILNRRKRNRVIFALVVLAVAGGAVGIGVTGTYRYGEGWLYEQAGDYKKAGQLYLGLNGFLDSEKRAQDCEAKVQAALAVQEQAGLSSAKTGDTLNYGNYKWKVLNREADKLYVIAVETNKYEELTNVQYHTEQTAVTWAASSLRQWLNGEFLQNGFTEEERARLVLMQDANGENEAYKTAGGEDTQDYVTLLSLSEAEAYREVLDTMKLDMWLRSPGSQPDTAAYVTAGSSIIDYGCPVTQTGLYIRPVILIDCTGSAAEEESE
ncbi:MAG: DUF6273 domain-containing protein [Lachnospiraceae bacterium]|nr:DUF6273 domain-containing protein [Lachnospiraceae bacterium]